MLTDNIQTQPVYAFDVDFVITKPPRYRLFEKFSKALEINAQAEMGLIVVKRSSVVVMLSQYEFWQNKVIENTIDRVYYNYLIPARTKDEFELFRNQFMPVRIFSKIPQLWQGEYSDVEDYDKQKPGAIFDVLREEIPFK